MSTQSYEKQIKALRWSSAGVSCVVLSQVMMLMNHTNGNKMVWLSFVLIVICLIVLNASFLVLPKAEKKEES